VSEVAKKHGISDVTIYAWRKRFGKLEAVDVKRLRHIEGENVRLKKLLAERDLEIEVMKEVAQKNGRRARAPASSRVSSRARRVDPASVRADVGCKINTAVRITSGQA
jgi:putative transposase